MRIFNRNMDNDKMNGTIDEGKSVDEIQPTPDIKRIKFASMKNLLVLCTASQLYDLSFACISSLESTVNAEEGIGMISQAIIYAVAIFSAVFLPDLIIKKIGSKWTYILCSVASCLYIASNFDVRWDFMMTSAVISGIANGPLAPSKAYYINEMARRYKTSDSESSESIFAGYFGISTFIGQSSQILGNLIIYYVLNSKNQDTNHTNVSNPECGVHFHPQDDINPNLTPPSEFRRYLVVGIFVALGILGSVIIAVFVDSLGNDINRDSQGSCKTIYNRLMASLKVMVNPHQLLLVFIAIYCGLEIAFYTSDFTQAYIACSLGINFIGSVTICFSITGAVAGLIIWPLVERTSQLSVMIVTAVVTILLLAWLFLWDLKPGGSIYLVMVVAGVWGVTDTIWCSMIQALYGMIFPDDREAAFANYSIWVNVGNCISFSIANYLPVLAKLSILTAIFVLGVLGYLIVQYKLRQSSTIRYSTMN